jgi:hypothetical protein
MDEFRKNLTAKEIAEIFRYELNEAKRPAQELILNDTDLCKMLKISKRTLATWRSSGVIAFHKVGGIVFYLFSDVLETIKSNRIESFQNNLNIKL